MAVEGSTAPALPLPPRVSESSPPTVGALLTKASAAANASAATARECSSPRSLLSRILHRGRGGGFGCRLRLPRYFSSGAAAKEEAREVAAPKVVGSQAEPRESPRSSLGKKPAGVEEALPASLGLGASLVLLLSKSAAELSRMAELRAQMERLLTDFRADVQSSNGCPGASDNHTDSASVVKEPIVCAADKEGALFQSDGSRTAASASRGASEDAVNRPMDQMEAELEAELSRLQLTSNDEERASPWRDHELEMEAKRDTTSGSHSTICSDNDDVVTDQGCDEGEDNEEEEEEEEECEEGIEKSPSHGGVSARELERRLHELLQSRHEARIAELESALERARRKLRDAEREASRWRDTAKIATRFTDESRLR